MNDTPAEPTDNKPEIAKDYLDLIRATINALTWVALSLGACMFLWRVINERDDTVLATLAGTSMVIAVLTSVGALYCVVVLADATRVKWQKRAPWFFRLLLNYYATLWAGLLAIAILGILLTPIVNQVYPTAQ